MEKVKYKKVFKRIYNELNDYVRSNDLNLPVKQREQNFLNFCMESVAEAVDTKSISAKEHLGLDNFYDCFVEDLNKDLLHIFPENPELELFLKNTKISSLESIKDFLDENTSENDAFSEDTYNVKTLSYAIHTPEEAYLVRGFVATPPGKEFCRENNRYIVFCWDSRELGYCIDLSDEKVLEELKKHKNNIDILNFQVAVNSMFYLKAFPDCLEPGVPQNMVKDDRNKTANNLVLKTAEEIVEKCERDKSGRIITPHFRSGSFHYLKSDYYKNKKGQTVWWSPSMVKGRASVMKDNKTHDSLKRNVPENSQNHKKKKAVRTSNREIDYGR